MLDMIRLNDIVSSVSFRDWKFVTGYMEGAMYVQVRFFERCVDTGVMMEQSGRKWLVSVHSTKSEIVMTCLMAVLAAVEHEARENFKYEGLPVFGPHPDIDALWETVNLMSPDIRKSA